MGKYSQDTVQVQQQVQALLPLQAMVARLTELPLDGLRERIDRELNDNNWLESSGTQTEDAPAPPTPDEEDRKQQESERYDDDDNFLPSSKNYIPEERELEDDTESFFDMLSAQAGEYNLNEHQHDVLQYLIGSLDDDGLLRIPLYQIMDELDIYQGIKTTEEELKYLLTILQQMDPPGVGGRNLQECLSIQARRYYKGEKRDMLLRIFQKYWDDFSHLRWDRIQHTLRIDQLQMEDLKHSIRKMNPRPGGSLRSSSHDDNHTILPDFFVDVDGDGKIKLKLNEGLLPVLTISDDAKESLAIPAVSKSEKEAQRYLRERVENAQMFIDAIAMRRRTMLSVMKAIIQIQRRFFREGDETLLKPMKLDDVAEMCGVDISTVSRVSNSKYVQTNHGLYPLRFFFGTGTQLDGEEVSVKMIHEALRELVSNEDPHHPLSDIQIEKILKQKGYDVARRTVAKYRTKLGIPESRLRKE